MQERLTDPKALFEVLSRHGADYVVVGGFAVLLHGGNNLTFDFDLTLMPDREARRKVADALNELNPRLRFNGPRLVLDEFAFGGRFTSIYTDAGKIDFVNQFPNGVTIEGIFERAITIKMFEFEVKLASLDDLIPIKEATGRERDRLHLEMLRQLKELRNTASASE